MPVSPTRGARARASAGRAPARSQRRTRWRAPLAPSAPRDLDDAGLAGEVVDHARFSTERVLEKVRDLSGERRIDLEERRAVRREHAREIRRRAPDELEAVLSRGHRESRLASGRGGPADEMRERVVAQIWQVR